MTEAEWLAGDWSGMAKFLGPRATPRKLRLFECACCRAVWHLFLGGCRTAVEVSERYADGLATEADLAAAQDGVEPDIAADHPHGLKGHFAACAVQDLVDPEILDGLYCATQLAYALARCDSPEPLPHAAILCELFGNPFRPVAFSPSWRTDTARDVARQMYESRDFSAMPILADALQDAGCDDPDVLNHCRGDGPHVRGCWVVDLLLGKE